MAVDCIVVGGGIIGMLTAFELTRQGLKVQIVEKGQIGKEASWAGGGILSPLSPWESPEHLWPMVKWSQQAYPTLCAELKESTGIDPQWVQSGLINFDKHDPDKVEHWSYQTGTDYRQINHSELIDLDRKINPRLTSAVLLEGVAQVRNPRLLKALQLHLQIRGVQISEGVKVESIVVEQSRLQAVETTAGRMNCKYVVIAAGAWSGAFLSDRTLVQPVRGQMLRLEVPAGFLRHILLRNELYIIPRQSDTANGSKREVQSQQLLIGSTLEYGGFDKAASEEADDTLYQKALELLPELANYPICQRWVGLRPGPAQQGVTPDRNTSLPLIGADPATQGLFYNTGHFRNGIVLAPASARTISDLIHSS